MAICKKEIISVRTILEKSLIIPQYQRPYKWHSQHVNQLFDDVLRHKNKSPYRLGTIVIHQDKEELSIVDGQQRLITLSLFCYVLDKQKTYIPSLLTHKFCSSETLFNLQHNTKVLQHRVKQFSDEDCNKRLVCLLDKCEVVCITLDDLSEAFQFFDAQNARGKKLAPYNLLKAYHLREMIHNTEKERFKVAGNWDAIDYREEKFDKNVNLETIISNTLFRIRKWTVGESGRFFNQNNIDVFKGISIHRYNYRYTKPLQALDYMVDHYNADAIRHWDQQSMSYPFLIDQTLLNGKRFFEYIQYYINIYKLLFINEKKELKDLIQLIDHYDGHKRVGDRYVKNLFYCVVLYYYDKFGDNELEKAAYICFIWSYQIRLKQKRVAMASVDNEAKKDYGLFRCIKKSLHPYEVLAYPLQELNHKDIEGTKINSLINKFKEQGYIIDASN